MRRGIVIAAAWVMAGCAGAREGDLGAGEGEAVEGRAAQAEGAERGGGGEPRVEGSGWREVFPGVRVNTGTREVEVEGIVPIDAHDARTPIVYLEVVACRLDTKEHESLVMTRALGSHVHAALVLMGHEPGAPGSWTWDGAVMEAHPPSGDVLEVRLVTWEEDGTERTASPNEWIVNERTGERPSFEWVFAGSRMVTRQGREGYDADGTGLVVGLTTFGSEVVACREVISHESQVQAPEWIADARVVPRFGTRAAVRVGPSR